MAQIATGRRLPVRQESPVFVHERAPVSYTRAEVYHPTEEVYLHHEPAYHATQEVLVHHAPRYEDPIVVNVEPAAQFLPVTSYPVIGEQLVGKKVDVAEHHRVVLGMERRVADLEARLSAALRGQERCKVLEDTCHSMEARLQALAGIEVNIRALEADNAQLQMQLRQMQAHSQDAARLKNDLDTVTAKCTRLATENRHLDEELQSYAADSNAKFSKLINERDILAREVTTLEKELQQGTLRISSLETELQNLVATLHAKDEELARLGFHAQDLERLRADNIRLIHEVDRSAEEIRVLERELQDSGRLRAELAELRRENEHLLLDAERYYQLKAEYDLLLAELERPVGRPMLGVEIKMLDDAAGNRDCVVVVHSITPGGPADMAGLRPGDVLKEWDGVLLDSKARFQRMLDQSPPGTRVPLVVIRGRTLLEVLVTVGAAPQGAMRTVRRVASSTQVDNVVQDPVLSRMGSQLMRAQRGSGSRTRHNDYGY